MWGRPSPFVACHLALDRGHAHRISIALVALVLGARLSPSAP
jgi:hypothetical protein